MRRVLFVTVAASMLTGCDLPDVDLAAYTPRSAASNADVAQHQQRPASPYEAGQPAENTGDYSNYF